MFSSGTREPPVMLCWINHLQTCEEKSLEKENISCKLGQAAARAAEQMPGFAAPRQPKHS